MQWAMHMRIPHLGIDGQLLAGGLCGAQHGAAAGAPRNHRDDVLGGTDRDQQIAAEGTQALLQISGTFQQELSSVTK